MIDIFVQDLEKYKSNQEKILRLRELLQMLILRVIHEAGYFRNICFLGGTALRIVHRLDRFSEDLDFSLADPADYSFHELMQKIVFEFKHRGLVVEIGKSRTERAVKSCFIKFSSLLYDLKLSPLKDQKVLIKFDIDENSSLGFRDESRYVDDVISFHARVLDLPSLFAGKTHALISRCYTKGRDFYDLQFYLAKGVISNFQYLNAALQQSGGSKINDTVELCSALREVIRETDFELVKRDVSNFVLDKYRYEHFSVEFFLNLILQYERKIKFLQGV